jgi:hypothetical protein
VIRRPGAGFLRRTGFRGLGGGGAAAPPSPLAIDGGAFIYLSPAGITEASGAVASWDDEGSAGARFSDAADVTERPAIITVGGRTCVQFDGSNDVLFSEASLQLVERYCVALVLRVDTYVANRRPFDFGGNAGYFAYFTDTADSNKQKWRYEQGASDLLGATPIANGEWHSIIVDVDDDSGTSTIYRNGASDGTLAGTSVAPGDITWAVGAVQSSGANSAAFTLADLSVHNNLAGAPDVAALFEWHEYLAGQMGVTLG